VYKIFFKVGSPEFIISRAARVFSSYYDTGELRIAESGPGRAVAELVGFEGGAPQFCERIFGWPSKGPRGFSGVVPKRQREGGAALAR